MLPRCHDNESEGDIFCCISNATPGSLSRSQMLKSQSESRKKTSPTFHLYWLNIYALFHNYNTLKTLKRMATVSFHFFPDYTFSDPLVVYNLCNI